MKKLPYGISDFSRIGTGSVKLEAEITYQFG